MGLIEGKREAPHRASTPVVKANLTVSGTSASARVWSFLLRVARNPWTRVVVLVLLTMLQMVLLWLVGELIDLSISLMELWAELARKHLEITLSE